MKTIKNLMSISVSLTILSTCAFADPITNGVYGGFGVGVSYDYRSAEGGANGQKSKGAFEYNLGADVGYVFNKTLKIGVNGGTSIYTGGNKYPDGYPIANTALTDLSYAGAIDTRNLYAEVNIGFSPFAFMGIQDKTLYLVSGYGANNFKNQYSDTGTYIGQNYYYIPIRLEGEMAMNNQSALRYGAFYNAIVDIEQENGRYKTNKSQSIDYSGAYEIGAKIGYVFKDKPEDPLKGFIDLTMSYGSSQEKPTPTSNITNSNFKTMLYLGIQAH